MFLRTMRFICFFIIMFGFAHYDTNAQTMNDFLSELPDYNLPPIPLIIEEGETVPVYEYHIMNPPLYEISGEGHHLSARHCESSIRDLYFGEYCMPGQRWLQVLTAEGDSVWIEHRYDVTPFLWTMENLLHNVAPYLEINYNASTVTLYAQPDHSESTAILQDVTVDGDTLVYGFNYDDTGVWYLARYYLVDYDRNITAWVHKPYPERLHWIFPMPDLPHVFFAENALAARPVQLAHSPYDMTIEAGMLLFLYHRAQMFDEYRVAAVLDDEWQMLAIPIDAIEFSEAVISRISRDIPE